MQHSGGHDSTRRRPLNSTDDAGVTEINQVREGSPESRAACARLARRRRRLSFGTSSFMRQAVCCWLNWCFRKQCVCGPACPNGANKGTGNAPLLLDTFLARHKVASTFFSGGRKQHVAFELCLACFGFLSHVAVLLAIDVDSG